MGTRAHVIVVASDLGRADLLGQTAVSRLVGLERTWSRFLPDSEISRLNTKPGSPVRVSEDVLLLVERAVEAWSRTDGRFDPTVLPALIASGYDRDFREIADAPERSRPQSEPAPGCADIRIAGKTVTLPPGTTIDPGGIGKGLAADITLELVMAAGATGACINVGGDLRVAGTSPTGAPWSVVVEHPVESHRVIGRVELRDEALVSSWRTRRSWGSGADRRHHLIDPATGESAWNGLAGVTVTAPEAWWAEALATAMFLAGPDEAPALARRHGGGAILVRDDGSVLGTGTLRDVVARGTEAGS
ncbi:MAG: FAD:protein FMN transferase [Acidimicrobiia bacterium]